MDNKIFSSHTQEYPPKEFKNVSAEDTLRWLERSSQFVRNFLSNEDIIKWRRARDAQANEK